LTVDNGQLTVKRQMSRFLNSLSLNPFILAVP